MTRLWPPDLRGTGSVGADLDLTLIDTRAATAVALHEVNRRLGAGIDIDAFLGRLGLAIRAELARSVPPDQIEQAVTVFRSAFMGEGIPRLVAMPGAAELSDHLAGGGRRMVVITSRIPSIAEACLRACGLTAAAVVGGVTGTEKAPAMLDHHIGVYLGDHVLDMNAAAAAGVTGIGVTTGAHTAGQLYDGGAHWVIEDLHQLVRAIV